MKIISKSIYKIRTQNLERLALIFTAFWLFAFLFNFTINKYINENVVHGWSVFDFIADRWIFVVDLKFQIGTSSDLNPYLSGRLEGYPPFPYLLLYIFKKVWELIWMILNPGGIFDYTYYNILIPFGIYFVTFISGWLLFVKQICNHHNHLGYSLLVVLFCYPVGFLIMRGNIDMMLFPMFLLFIFLWDKKSKMSYIPLGILMAYKPQFLIFSSLYFIDTNYGQIIKSLVIAMILTFISMLAIQGDLSEQLANIVKQNIDVKEIYGINNLGVRYGHSFLNLYKLILMFLGVPGNTALVIRNYEIFTLSISFFIIVYLWLYRHRFEDYQKALIVSILMCAVPYFSYDFKLIIILPLIVLYSPYIPKGTYILLVVLMLPKNFYFYSISEFSHPLLPIGSFINPAILLILLIFLLRPISKDKAVIESHASLS